MTPKYLNQCYETLLCFPFQNNPKDLDLSNNTDLDFWDCFGREKLPFSKEIMCTYGKYFQVSDVKTVEKRGTPGKKTNKASDIIDPLSNMGPLGAAIDGMDPLSMIAAEASSGLSSKKSRASSFVSLEKSTKCKSGLQIILKYSFFYFIPSYEFNAYLKQIKVILSAVKK